MKIDCPHCGVHGSVDDSLAGRKLRCPQCTKIFLVTEDILPEFADVTVVHQEILYDETLPGVDTPVDEPEALVEEVTAESGDLQQCSGCKQSFASLFLEEVDSKLYCTLCRPDRGAEASDFPEDGDISEDLNEELLEIEEDDSEEEYTVEAGGDILDFMEDGESDEAADISSHLEVCSGCGESLHPDFLETVGEQRYCALCAPEEGELEEFTDMAPDLSEVAADPIEQDISHGELSEADEENLPKESCSVCGEKFHRDFMQEIDSQFYCGVCQPKVVQVLEDYVDSAADDDGATDEVLEESLEAGSGFSVGELLKDAWHKTKGAKGAVWGGIIVMYLLLFGLSFGGTLGFQQFYKGTDPTVSLGVNAAIQLFAVWISILMTGGIMLIGVRRAKEQRVSWRMAFSGFSSAFSITMAIILQCILVTIGLVLLVLPGIYLAVGYGLALPLILDKGMGPWEALEASRKAIHKKWWTVLGMYILMFLLYTVSAILLGIGLIWTIPMSFVLVGVLYVRLFGVDDDNTGEGFEEEFEEEFGEELEEIEELFEDSKESESINS